MSISAAYLPTVSSSFYILNSAARQHQVVTFILKTSVGDVYIYTNNYSRRDWKSHILRAARRNERRSYISNFFSKNFSATGKSKLVCVVGSHWHRPLARKRGLWGLGQYTHKFIYGGLAGITYRSSRFAGCITIFSFAVNTW